MAPGEAITGLSAQDRSDGVPNLDQNLAPLERYYAQRPPVPVLLEGACVYLARSSEEFAPHAKSNPGYRFCYLAGLYYTWQLAVPRES
ncbi:hypothetical protein PspLS_01671, partial [Pyricularia sp. CBS 133598]